jgi:hypothetical protein
MSKTILYTIEIFGKTYTAMQLKLFVLHVSSHYRVLVNPLPGQFLALFDGQERICANIIYWLNMALNHGHRHMMLHRDCMHMPGRPVHSACNNIFW